jgi:hypothetical protein
MPIDTTAGRPSEIAAQWRATKPLAMRHAAARQRSSERFVAKIAERIRKRKTARNFSIWCIYRRIPRKASAKPVTAII